MLPRGRSHLERTVRLPPRFGNARIDWSPAIIRNAFVSTYPPRRCGVASFTHDLARAIGTREIVALHPPEQVTPYALEVHHRVRRDELGDYARTAVALSHCVDVVSIQYDPRIWGGQDGEYVLDFVRALNVPAVATFHAIPRLPTTNERGILTELIAAVEAAVVMSNSAATLLTTTYGIDARRIDVIPHGVPDLPLVDPATIKPALGLEGRDVILALGLMSPAKGYELALDALPAIVAAHPTACLVIVGPTHPELLRSDGETYRQALVARVKALGMTGHVQFVDRFIGRVELTRWLEGADVFITSYPNLDQTVSGTLSYAMGAGRAIVSTPYAYAAELLADGRGVLVAPASPARFAAAVNKVLGDDGLRAAIGRRAYDYGRGMVWSRVGARYTGLFERVTAQAPVAGTGGPWAAVSA